MCSILVLLVILFCVGCPHNSISSDVSDCPSEKNIQFTITTSRNRTGHWTAKVTAENAGLYSARSGDGVLRTDQWKLELDHVKSGCDGMESLSTIITLPPPEGAPGYELFEDVGYYKFHTHARRWLEALKICEKEGAHLAIINSKKESAVLRDLFERYPKIPSADFNNAAGIGFHDRYTEGEYLTIYDKPLASTGFMRWSTAYHQPDNWQGSDTNPGEDCGSIRRDGGLNDVSCDIKIAFICEREL